MNNVKIFTTVIVVLILGVVATAVVRSRGGSSYIPTGQYDAFVSCLKEKGAVFYGAFWCPHCQAQKKMFGSSAKDLPYVECSTLDAKGTTQVCKDKNITGYPTWEFADGSRLGGEVSLTDLAAKTSCTLPEGANPQVPVESGVSSPAN
ncbi:hypothetical protein HZA26_03970 [Candidatus Nomurabacteria bacterium]|nr:hypothetical protein [Candidatus Nomurabacteria bacterium]